LKAIVAEVDAQGTGIVDRHPYDLEDKGSHRGEIMMRWWHFTSEVKVDPSTMLAPTELFLSGERKSEVLITCSK
jgi:hypothetical protein